MQPNIPHSERRRRSRKGILPRWSNFKCHRFSSPTLNKRTAGVVYRSAVSRVSCAWKNDTIPDGLRGGGGPGRTSCFGEATLSVIVSVSSPLRSKLDGNPEKQPTSHRRRRYLMV
ncbi:hypothetical protein PUN28_000671 [Cardiocondyla obscurior]|uniref:Uncharacterized protein n=1 Tax=Cardiocondyla obscurior TaxID=286306 RepID=A0AAW2H0Y4_9HYME